MNDLSEAEIRAMQAGASELDILVARAAGKRRVAATAARIAIDAAGARHARRAPVLNAAYLERVVVARVLARPDARAALDRYTRITGARFR